MVNRKKVGNRIKDNSCWSSLCITLKGWGCWVSNFWASSVSALGPPTQHFLPSRPSDMEALGDFRFRI